ncbi:hypothetical protein [Gluconobacter wancherniae]|uniref:hypothetical protein n=1 Tax=Gluconobacter wancherniae TaxID=1307955 RepID=UPI002011E9CA|nr:hypothetical protein [Gluconobacter wancherniae]
MGPTLPAADIAASPALARLASQGARQGTASTATAPLMTDPVERVKAVAFGLEGQDTALLQDAQELLTLLFPDETPADDKPFAKLFETLVPPSAQLPRTTEPLHPHLDKALLAELVAFETTLGQDERAAVETVTHALNLYARGQELA